MIADHDRRINPLWPHVDQDPVQRARQIALMYRQRLRLADPAAADQADDLAARFGETWMLPQPETAVDGDRELTTAEAAELVGVSPGTIRNWACQPHPDDPSRPLLRRFKMRGRQRTYLAGDVRDADAAMRRAQHARAWSW